jgi:hypothetical protein
MTQFKTVNKNLSSIEQDLLHTFERKMTSIYERGGFSALKGRQLFVNASTSKLQLRLQHMQMLFRDNDVLSTKGSLVYFIKTAKKTDFKKFDTNQFVLKKFFFVKTDQSVSPFAVRDYYISDKSNVEFSEISNTVEFSLPTFSDIHKKISEMIVNKEISSIEANFSLDYLAYLSKCLGKQPRFSLTLEQAIEILNFATPEWIQNTFDKTWLAVDPLFKQSKVDVLAQNLNQSQQCA